MIDLYRVNLNLLVALDSLLEEQSVTLAAKKLFLTQSAMSNNLQQLRIIFKDELLIRENKRMILTSNAKALQPKLHAVLQELQSIIANEKCFNPATSTRIFRIGMPDYMTTTVLPKIMVAIQKQAPEVKIIIKAIEYIESTQPFENGDYDLTISVIMDDKIPLRKKILFKDEYLCIMNRKHPLAKKEKITLTEYLSQKQIGSYQDRPGTIDIALAAVGKKRNVYLYLSFFGSILKMIETSDVFIANIAVSLLEAHKKNYQYVTKELPFKTPGLLFQMAWHEAVENDAGHEWLRDLIVNAVSK